LTTHVQDSDEQGEKWSLLETTRTEGAICLRALNRRQFLARAVALAGGMPLVWRETVAQAAGLSLTRYDTRVALASCRSYGDAVRQALKQCFDLLGEIGSLVRNRTVTVKINLTATNFSPFLNHPVGEVFMTHYSTAYVLTQLLVEAGARRIRFAESTNSRAELGSSLVDADWDTKALSALGRVEFENTRSLGTGRSYGTLRVPGGGLLFSHFDLNRAYTDTDVVVSLCKLKQHVTTGVTLSLKNMFGITPNSLYGEEAGDENATKGRLCLHNPTRFRHLKFPGAKEGIASAEPEYRMPRIVRDVCAARPVHLAIIDGITSMSGGEGWWCSDAERVAFIQPGVLIAGFNPVCTDAVGTAVMGYANPRAPRGEGAFKMCDNMLLLAEEAGLGTADLSNIEMLGLPIVKARCPFPELNAARSVTAKAGKASYSGKQWSMPEDE
jgi:uncharacterized protein (DUF362 family)